VSDWTFKIEFSSATGTTYDISEHVLYDSIGKSEQLYGSGGIGAVDTFEFTIKHSTFTDTLFAADQKVYFTCETTTGNEFTGIIDSGYSQSYGQIVGPISIEAVDNSYKLDKPIKNSFQYPTTWEGTQYMIFATSSTGESLIHYLLNDAGYAAADIGSTGSITDTLEHVAETEGERTYRDFIDSLLPEYGYTYKFDQDGKFQTVSLRAPSTASYTFSDSNIAVNPGLTRKKTLQDHEAIEVEWTELAKRVQDYLYTDEGEIENGYWDDANDLLVSGNYPKGSSSDTIWFSYDPKNRPPAGGTVTQRTDPRLYDQPWVFV